MSIIQSIIGTNLTISASGGGGPASDFTIEWFQKVENNFQNARPWSVGLYSTQILSISYESLSADYYWINNSIIGNTSANHLTGNWEHMAFVRYNSVVYGYLNGTQYFSAPADLLITESGVPLYVGTGEIAAGMFKGYITNLHIIKGVAKYTSNFSAPVSPIVSQTGSVFLMPAYDSGTAFNDTVGSKSPSVSGSPTWSSDSPFTAYGPYTQASNAWTSSDIDFNGGNYNSDLLNVKKGWTVTDGFSRNGVVITDAYEAAPGVIRISVNFNPAAGGTWTFTQPGLGSVYFNSSSYLDYGSSVDWAMDL